MTFLESLSEKVRNDKPIPWYLDALLRAGTPLYRIGMIARGMRKPVKVDARVVSFGNLTVGGTGKTPAVIERAQAEIAAGNTVAVLTRGYGATQRLDVVVCARGADAAGLADTIGDEPALIARRVPGVVIARSANRVVAARRAIEQYACNVLILDDGFQYLRLARDENVLVIDASNPFGNGHLLPRGILREPFRAAARATHIVLTHCDRVTVDAVQALASRFETARNGAPIRTTRHAPDSLWSVDSGATLSLDTLRGTPVVAACAIARPESFLATLRSLGADVVETLFFPDHAQVPGGALRSEHMIIVTEKDAARISTAPSNVYALGVRLADWQASNA